jgi:hypothetical protein
MKFGHDFMSHKNGKMCIASALKPKKFYGSAALFLCIFSNVSQAQEFSLFGGASQGMGDNTYAWAINYQEGLGRNFAASFMWLNEGHIPGHHRDGQAVQLWARLPLEHRRLVLSVGAGPYRYFDTYTGQAGVGYVNTHGWGMTYSARATYYTSKRWVEQLEVNRVEIPRGPGSTAVLLGIGYQLDASGEPGASDWSACRTSNVSHREVTAFLGQAVVNSNRSGTALAEAIDYRLGLTKYMDLTVGYLHEGDKHIARRDGITAQLWATRAFFSDTFTLGVGAGTYYALKENEDSATSGPGKGEFSGLISISASYRLGRHWTTRVTWNRVVTHYNRDTDVLMGGVGYRF